MKYSQHIKYLQNEGNCLLWVCLCIYVYLRGLESDETEEIEGMIPVILELERNTEERI